MKIFKEDDDKIQEGLDNNILPSNSDNVDIQAYQTLYDVLSLSEGLELPDNFAEAVVLKIEKKKNLKTSLALILGIIGSIVLFSAAFAIQLFYFPSVAASLKPLFEFKWPIFSFAFMLLTIQILDWYLIKKNRDANLYK